MNIIFRVPTLKRFIEYVRYQSINGGILASSIYKPYRKVWLRDHAFASISLLFNGYDITPQIKWLSTLFQLESSKVRILLEMDKNHPDILNQNLHPRARYTPHFQIINEFWSERQYDGVALSLALIALYKKYTCKFPVERKILDLFVDYLIKFHDTPCADQWEMHENFIHAETLGSIFFGLRNAAELYPRNSRKRLQLINFTDYLRTKIHSFVKDGVLLKMKRELDGEACGLDSSVLLNFTLFDVIQDREIIKETLNKLYESLSPDGMGLRRFLIPGEKDVYFGGGVWYITTYWAAEAYFKLNEIKKAKKLLLYRLRFPLPEQIIDDTLIFDPQWKKKWMEISRKENNGIPGPADPLTWSNSEFARILNYTVLL